MSSDRHDYIHPALRPLVNTVAPAPQTLYRDLIQRIAESAPDATSVRDLPELSLEDLGVILKHNPLLFLESVADTDPELGGLCADRLAEPTKKISERHAHIGLVIVGAVRCYVKPLVLRDVQQEIERQRGLDAMERLSAPSEERAAVREGQAS